MNQYTVGYQYGTYQGQETIWADDEDAAIAQLWRDFSRRGLLTLLPMAYRRAWIIAVN